jgi:drug/metabolite transporter (DMT)-like permease
VLLFGVAGLFGKLISGSPVVITFARTAIAALVMLLVLRIAGISMSIASRRESLLVAATGLLLAAHWVTFFHAIQVSSVAIGLIGYAIFPLIVVLLEPVLFRQSYSPIDIACGVAATAGLLVVAPAFELADTATQGLIWAVLSGSLFAFLTLMNRRVSGANDFRVITFRQYAVAAVVLSPLTLAGSADTPPSSDVYLLLLLGLVFTALPHSLFLKALTRIKASHASVVAGLEPVYGITFAALLLREYPDAPTFFGAALVLGAVLVSTYFHRQKDGNALNENSSEEMT